METNAEVVAEAESYSVEIRGWYRVVRNVVRFLLSLLAGLDIEGLEHVPDKGPYLLVSNHLHWLDPPVIMAVFPHRARLFAAAKREKHWFFGPLFRSLGVIWVHRGEVDRRALRQALAVLKGGAILGMAPEGTRSATGAMQRGRGGVAYLAYRANVNVVPVVVTGQERVFSTLARLRRPRIRAAFGLPFKAPAVPKGERVSSADIRAFTEEIMYRLAAMLPAEYRGLYADVADKRPDLLAPHAAQGH
jgi:1-acyl-sn-glycerol-3-phosphate acyltransferase